jgi:Fic family protein
MASTFSPNYQITSRTASGLIRIESVKERVFHLPLTPLTLRSLRESAKLFTTHYSTAIEGNKLRADEVAKVIKKKTRISPKQRDEREVKGYYEALSQIEKWVASGDSITEKTVQTIHALVMSGGREKVKPNHYRDGQNVIRDSRSGAIIYMPPEAKDVPALMRNLILWIKESSKPDEKTKLWKIPCPIVAAIAHYQFATIHPYFDGNGRTARLLTTMILHLGGYDLKGLYSLEEYYAKNLQAYYDAISVGDHHNYYFGRAESNITNWVEYFTDGAATSFENVLKHMSETQTANQKDNSKILRSLDIRQRKVLELFEEFEAVTSAQIGNLFGFQARTNSQICKKWCEEKFLEVADNSNKARKYRLAKRFRSLIEKTKS